MSQNTFVIFKKLADLEQQVQRLKVQLYFKLSKKQRASFAYPQASINSALQSTRNQIWQEKYAKKLARIS